METTTAINVSEALSRADGDQDLFLTLAGLFLQESPKEAAAARAALERQDCAGLMAAPRLFECAKRLEELGRQGELAEASSICTDVEACLAEVHAALRKLIAGGFPS
jgi:histidine phosphotransfer protein HptB